MKNSWNYLARGTIAALEAVINKWYADCFNTEAEIQRLILWEQKLKKKLIQEVVAKAPPKRQREVLDEKQG